MAKRVNPTIIGLFVVGSFAVLLAALVVVGSGKLFRQPLRFICMFPGDLNGLKVGAPVKVRGVQVGTVEAIKLRLSPSMGQLKPNENEFRLPVIVDLDRSQLIAQGGTGEAIGNVGFEESIKQGMRAQLQTESLLTGLLYVDLDIHRNAPLHLVIVPGSGPYREIPTVPTQMEAVQEKAAKALAQLEQIDFQGMAVSITNAANSINQLAGSPAIKTALASLSETSEKFSHAAVSISAAVDKASGKIDPLVASVQRTSAETDATLKETRDTLLEVQSALDPDSPIAIRLNVALEQMTETARSVGDLADYLRRNPSALIRGKYVSDKER
ncbi:MAG TPA: MlaD family protein [Candidatus Binataceae bacterium]|jgi:paraquat-inducible protein B